MGEVVQLRPPAQSRPLIVGVQQHVLAEDHEIDKAINGFTTPELTMYRGSDSAEQFSVLDEIAQKRAKMFWQFDTGLSIAPNPDTDTFRLRQLSYAYDAIPDLSEEEEALRARWKKIRSNVSAIGRIMYEEIKINGDIGYVPAIELFDDPYVNHHLLNDLDYNGDPRLAVVKSFERWRVQNAVGNKDHPNVDRSTLEKGYRSFELFMFGAGGTAFKKKLKEVAKLHFLPE